MGLTELLPIVELISRFGFGIVMGGVVVFVLLYMLRVHLPDMEKRHRHNDALVRAEFRETLERIEASCSKQLAYRDELIKREIVNLVESVNILTGSVNDLLVEIGDRRRQREQRSKRRGQPDDSRSDT